MATFDLGAVKYTVKATLADGSGLELTEVAENIAWEDNEKELSARLNLTLRDVPVGSKRLNQMLPLCTIIYLYSDWGEGVKEIWRGTIWETENSVMNSDAVTVTGYDMLYYLQKSQDNRYYAAGKTTKAVVQDIASDWNVPLGTFNVTNKVHEKLLYKKKNIAAMLTETLDDAKKMGGDKYVIRAESGKMCVLKRGSNGTIYSFTADSSIITGKDRYSMTDLVTRVVVTGKEDKEGRPKVETTIDGKTQYGILQEMVEIGSGKLADAKEKANDLLKDKGEPERTITLQTLDFPPVRKGDQIHVKTDRLNGYYIVKGVSHNVTAMTMQMELEAAA